MLHLSKYHKGKLPFTPASYAGVLTAEEEKVANAPHHTCPFCAKPVSSQKRWVDHVSQAHIEDDKTKAYACATCKMTFTRKWALTKHVQRDHARTLRPLRSVDATDPPQVPLIWRYPMLPPMAPHVPRRVPFAPPVFPAAPPAVPPAAPRAVPPVAPPAAPPAVPPVAPPAAPPAVPPVAPPAAPPAVPPAVPPAAPPAALPAAPPAVPPAAAPAAPRAAPPATPPAAPWSWASTTVPELHAYTVVYTGHLIKFAIQIPTRAPETLTLPDLVRYDIVPGTWIKHPHLEHWMTTRPNLARLVEDALVVRKTKIVKTLAWQ
jgi:uncharacterized C2H2 Zn-finger protein